MEFMFNCCKNKPPTKEIKHCFCIVCLNVFHKSCVERKQGFQLIENHKILCSKVCNDTYLEQQGIESNVSNPTAAKLVDLKKRLDEREKRCFDLKSVNKSLATELQQAQEKLKSHETRIRELEAQLINSEAQSNSDTAGNSDFEDVLKKSTKEMMDMFGDAISKKLDTVAKVIVDSNKDLVRLVTNMQRVDHCASPSQIVELATPDPLARGPQNSLSLLTSGNDASGLGMSDYNQQKAPITSSAIGAAINNAFHQRSAANNKPNSNNRPQHKLSMGTASSTLLKAVPPSDKKWLYLGRLCEDVSENDLINYVQSKCQMDGKDLSIKLLKTYNNMRSFKLGLQKNYYNQVNNCEFWPAGVVFRDFVFEIRQNSKSNFLPPTNLQAG